MSESRDPIDIYDRELCEELRRQVDTAGSIPKIAAALDVVPNTLRGWLDVPGRITARNAMRVLVACGRPADDIAEVVARACIAAGAPLAAVYWCGATFYGRPKGLMPNIEESVP